MGQVEADYEKNKEEMFTDKNYVICKLRSVFI